MCSESSFASVFDAILIDVGGICCYFLELKGACEENMCFSESVKNLKENKGFRGSEGPRGGRK